MSKSLWDFDKFVRYHGLFSHNALIEVARGGLDLPEEQLETIAVEGKERRRHTSQNSRNTRNIEGVLDWGHEEDAGILTVHWVSEPYLRCIRKHPTFIIYLSSARTELPLSRSYRKPQSTLTVAEFQRAAIRP